LESGQFQAIGAQPPQSSALEARDYNIVGRAAPLLPDMALTATGTTAERVGTKRAEVRAFATAFLEALRFQHAEREGAARVAASWLDLDLATALAAYDQAIDTFSRNRSFAETTLRPGVEIEREKDATLSWERPVGELGAGDVLMEAPRALGLALP
jgi:ABC-type nitrate/sulfonate/bicarbonate transport system substrate-binding protein